jgi:hypothetical protein
MQIFAAEYVRKDALDPGGREGKRAVFSIGGLFFFKKKPPETSE